MRRSGALTRLGRERFAAHWRWFAAGTLCAALTSVAAAS
ncbi:MAG: subfamily B ATP-binding cassette protein MsbA, partial [Hyphomonas sp.]